MAIALVMGGDGFAHPSTSFVSSLWVPNGDVDASVFHGSTMYVAGLFTRVGPNTGPFAMVDNTSGAPKTFPLVNGQVLTIAADPSGGFYIGGTFTAVGGIAESNIAHVKANGDVDTAFAASTNGSVQSLALSPDGLTLYVGGGMTAIDGQPRAGAGAVDPTTGAVTAFVADTQLTSSLGTKAGSVDAVSVSGDSSTVYLGGNFTSVDGTARTGLAALTAAGTVTSFNPQIDGAIGGLTISPDGTVLYLSGFFDHVHGLTRHDVAAVSTATGLPNAFDPNATTPLDDISPVAFAVSSDGATVYVGGGFPEIGGASRKYLAALDAATGQATSYDPQPDDAVSALALSTDGVTLEVAGNFTKIGGRLATGVAKLSTSSGTVTSAAVRPDKHVYAMALSPDGATIALAGNFESVSGSTRHSVAAFDLTTGKLTPFAPTGGPGSALAISPDGSTLYVGGSEQNSLYAVNTATGAIDTSFNPQMASGFIQSLALSPDGKTLYVGGDFDSLGGRPRHSIAALDAATGQATSFQADAYSGGSAAVIESLAVSSDGSTVYVGGYFDQIGGAARSYLAAVDGTTGAVRAFAPNPDSTVKQLALSDDDATLYVAGYFTTIDGVSRNGSGAVDTSTGQPTSFDPGSSAGALAVSGSEIFLGARSIPVGGGVTVSEWNADGTPGPFEASTDRAVTSLAAVGDTLVVGGSFSTVDDSPRPYLALFPGVPETSISSGPGSSTSSTTARFSFGATVPGSTFRCSLDGAAFSPCSSPKTYSGLALGPHTFDVDATAGGKTDSTPADYGWTIVGPDGSGTMTVAQKIFDAGMRRATLGFTYTAATGGMAGGALTLTVPSGWSAPSLAGTNPGFTTASAGVVGVSGRTITISGVTLSAGDTLQVFYGAGSGGGPGATVGSTTGTLVWPAKEESSSDGTLTSLKVSPRLRVYAADGSGTAHLSTSSVPVHATGKTIGITYTAATGGMFGGGVSVTVPTGWSLPSRAGSAPGYATASSGTVIISGRTITVDHVDLAAGATLKIMYGSRAGGGPGATETGAAGTQTWDMQQRSSQVGFMTSIASSPQLRIVAD